MGKKTEHDLDDTDLANYATPEIVFLLQCPVCNSVELDDTVEKNALVCQKDGSWYNQLNNTWYLPNGKKLPKRK